MSKNIIFLCRALPRLSQLASADKVPVTLVGFSKGCAVLNQVLCDIRTAFSDIGDSNLHLREFAKNSLERMVWLDGTMGDGGWVNSPLLYKPQPKWADLSGPQWDPIFGPNPRYGPQGPLGQKIYLTFHPFRE